MTPDEHRARAEALAGDADELYEMVVDQEGSPVAESDWRILDVRIRLARLHAHLAQLPSAPPAAPDFSGAGAETPPAADTGSALNHRPEVPEFDFAPLTEQELRDAGYPSHVPTNEKLDYDS
ncbi:hypothetical protein [Actinoplanes sp. URMC 104]|uniref:hypothetical protein n=1 Tax=Actinoplanes sp. URMC 104 TaxID=3423409 RepID=UPI003F19EFC5